MSASAILVGCGTEIDERVDVSKISNNSDAAIIASCAMQAADKLVASMPANVGPVDVVGIDILKSVVINDDLNLIDFKVQQYSEKLGRVIPKTFTDFRCYSTVEAMVAEKERKIEQAIAEDEQRHQQAILAARKKAKQDVEVAERAVLEAKRAAEIKLIEDEAAAKAAASEAKRAAEIKLIEDEAAAKAAASEAKRAAEIKLLEDKAAIEAARVQAIQWKARKLEEKNKAEEDRKYRKKYDPIAKQCLNDATIYDFTEFKKTVLMPSSNTVGSNSTAFWKPINMRALDYAVSEGTITIQYEYDARLFFKIKRNGEIKDGYDTYSRKGSFICEIPI